MQTIGVTLRGDLGEVHYAGLCKMRRGLGAHLVLAGDHGPVTLLVMPEEAAGSSRSVSRGPWRGVILPVGAGSVAIVGPPNEPLEAIGERVGAVFGAGRV
jgi:hypothetical protein